jgi:hypothetical protein
VLVEQADKGMPGERGALHADGVFRDTDERLQVAQVFGRRRFGIGHHARESGD